MKLSTEQVQAAVAAVGVDGGSKVEDGVLYVTATMHPPDWVAVGECTEASLAEARAAQLRRYLEG